jgi:uncharacterized membrane protein
MKRGKRLWVGAAAAGAIVAVALTASAMRPRCTQVAGDRQISIPLAQIARGAIAFFCYHDQAGDRVRFILARDQDGKVHSVLDACHRCYSYHEGYASSHGDLVCRYCGNRYKLKTMEKGQASCVPVSLPSRQRNGLIVVQVSDLKRGRALF